MADDCAPARDATAGSEDFRDVVESAGVKLKERLRGKEDSATKTYGFDVYGTQLYEDILEPVVSHEVGGISLYLKVISVAQSFLQELKERHSGGKFQKLEIFVSTMTIKHDKAKISNVHVSENKRKVVWLLALFVDTEEKDKIGRSFSLGTRFNIVEGEIFLGFEVV